MNAPRSPMWSLSLNPRPPVKNPMVACYVVGSDGRRSLTAEAARDCAVLNR